MAAMTLQKGIACLASLILLIPTFSSASSIPVLASRQFSEVSGTPFGGFDDCSSSQINDIVHAWKDVVALVDSTPDFDEPGSLEWRFFGTDIGERATDKEFIHNVFTNLRNVANGMMNSPIRIACKDIYQTHRTDSEQVKCNNAVAQGSIGGYAFSYGPEHEDGTVVLCPSFFETGRQFLDEIRREMVGRTDAAWMAGKARTLLHEMTHLPSMSSAQEVVILDQELGANSQGVYNAYGLWKCEKLARLKEGRLRAHLNADSYAWYALEKWYQVEFNSIPDAAMTPKDLEDADNEVEAGDGGNNNENTGPTKALTILLEYSGPQGTWVDSKWLFYSSPFGESRVCQPDPLPDLVVNLDPSGKTLHNPNVKIWPGGTYDVKTLDGDCQYMNDGQGNAGALWCGDQRHDCRAHDKYWEWNECVQMGQQQNRRIDQMPVVVCEW